MLILAQNDGTVVYKSRAYSMVSGQKIHFPTDRALMEAEIQGHDPSQLLQFEIMDFEQAEALQFYQPGQLEVTIESGVITSVQITPEPPALYVHTTLTGGMQSPSGTLYLKNDGLDLLQVHAELRDGPDPATSGVVTQLEGQDITAMWALELVNVETGVLADTPLVQMTEGVIDVSYTTTIAPCEVELAEDRLQPIGDYQLKLAQPVRFKIVRALA